MANLFWLEALSAGGGLAVVAAFVFWSLYRGLLRVGMFPQLTKRQTFVLMMTFLILAFVAFLSVVVAVAFDQYISDSDSDSDSDSELEVRLQLEGALDIRDPTVDLSNVSIGLLWGIEDDRTFYWTDAVVSGARFSVQITTAEPPEDALMYISAVNSSTPGRQELSKLGVAYLIAYHDTNGTKLFDSGDDLLGGCATHVVTFLDGLLPNRLNWSIPQGYSLARAVPPEEHGTDSTFDILRSVQSSTRVSVIAPRSRSDIRLPNWT